MSSKCNRRKRGRSGFTVVEAVLVVVVVAILMMIAVPNFFASSKRSSLARVKSDFRTLATAIEAYTVDYDQPPIGPVNYAGDTAPGVYRRVTNSTEVFTPLTTPVAYLAYVSGFTDPLRGSGKGKRPGSVSHGFLFINFMTGVNAIESNL